MRGAAGAEGRSTKNVSQFSEPSPTQSMNPFLRVFFFFKKKKKNLLYQANTPRNSIRSTHKAVPPPPRRPNQPVPHPSNGRQVSVSGVIPSPSP